MRENGKLALLVFGIVTAGGAVYGLVRGHALGETLIAAVILGAFVVGIAYIGKIADARLKRK